VNGEVGFWSAHEIWKEWVLEKYGKMKYSNLDKATEIIIAALSDGRMRNVLRMAVCSEIRPVVAGIIDEYEKTNITVYEAASRIASLDRRIHVRRQAEKTK